MLKKIMASAATAALLVVGGSVATAAPASALDCGFNFFAQSYGNCTGQGIDVMYYANDPVTGITDWLGPFCIAPGEEREPLVFGYLVENTFDSGSC